MESKLNEIRGKLKRFLENYSCVNPVEREYRSFSKKIFEIDPISSINKERANEMS